MPAAKTLEATEINFAPVAESSAVPAVVEAAPPPAALTGEGSPILGLIERASRDPNVDIDKMERLIAMHERVQAEQNRREFDNAMASAQEAMKAIRANLENKQTKSEYASYAQLDKAVRPIYSRQGFALSFNTGDAPNPNEVRVLCTVSHRAGHRQDYKIDMPADGKGPQGAAVMTRTHATGAAASYGQRYLLKLIFNLAVGDVDDDGNGAGFDGGDDVEALAPKNAPRDAEGKLLSTYNAERAKQAQQWADEAIQYLNMVNARDAQEWRREKQKVPQGKRKSPLQWLADNSPGQYVRVQQCYQNVTGDDLE
jgi:hypothetical protein